MSPYTKKQIIKHSLEYYIQRPDADPKDVHREKTVLRQVEEDINREMERNGIKPKERRKQ
ncbi:hypothetical protein [Enterococcus avium]|uniref:hypothetical protein n=1 Tax=Enterococcus avium TaxID=33945 RepID=UPI00288DB1B5|nr:hypothetical protein [Enterococcus avium]MDT2483157.1 hypothetical protein [Enterococcus avium]MDT2509713.1 hypothetical protein [Enterococcus avium]